jgi:hypothetical protein
MAQLENIVDASQKMLNDQATLKPICSQGHECVGWGVNGVTGKPTPFPVVTLSYDPTRTDKRFNGLNEPLEVIANHVVDPVWASVDETQSFARIEEFVQHVNSAYTGATPAPKGTNGIYSRGFANVFDTFFQKKDDRALSVVRASKSYIQMALPVDPVTHTRQYHFDRHANDFINSLPTTYETDQDKEQFRTFIENWGTSFATSATLGGRVEQYSSWKTWITDSRMGAFDKDKLAANAEIDFYAKTGLSGSSGGSHDPGYERIVQPLNCNGGDSTVGCESDFDAWAKTLREAPVLLDYELAPISDLVTDPDVKTALEAAVREYVADEEKKWAAKDKCPVNCGAAGAGTCAKGQSSCTCKYKGIVGRMCSGCAPMSVRGTFTNIHGSHHEAVRTLKCDGKQEDLWSGPASCEETSLFETKTCDTTAAVQCTRESNGNLKAHVVQKGCTINWIPGQSDTVTQERRLLRSRGRRLGENTCRNGFSAGSGGSHSVSSQSASASAKAGYKRMPKCEIGKKGKKCVVTAKCEFE